jgi:hypothetical protein
MGTRVYVGGLPRDASNREVNEGFNRYGKIANVWVARNPPGFAFVVSEIKNSACFHVRLEECYAALSSSASSVI